MLEGVWKRDMQIYLIVESTLLCHPLVHYNIWTCFDFNVFQFWFFQKNSNLDHWIKLLYKSMSKKNIGKVMPLQRSYNKCSRSKTINSFKKKSRKFMHGLITKNRLDNWEFNSKSRDQRWQDNLNYCQVQKTWFHHNNYQQDNYNWNRYNRNNDNQYKGFQQGNDLIFVYWSIDKCYNNNQ